LASAVSAAKLVYRVAMAIVVNRVSGVKRVYRGDAVNAARRGCLVRAGMLASMAPRARMASRDRPVSRGPLVVTANRGRRAGVGGRGGRGAVGSVGGVVR